MLRCDAAFKKSIKLRCYDALEVEGFTRFRKEGVDRPLYNGFHCWIGLNTGLYYDRVVIEPFVGIHVVPIEKLSTIKGRKYDRGVATYALHMSELASASKEFVFEFTRMQSDAFIESEARRLAELYSTVGFDYASSIASYEAVLPLLQGRLDWLGGYPERVACCLYLMGRAAEARAFAEGFLAQEPSYFRSFGQPFLKMIGGEQAGVGGPKSSTK